MENYKDKLLNKNDENAKSTQGRPQLSQMSSGRININDINKRNAEQDKRERKSSYTTAGIIVLLIVFIIVAIYFFS